SPGPLQSPASGPMTGGRRQTPNGRCSARHTSQFVVRCNQPTRVDVIETSWPAERGCTERFRGKPASINASHQRSTAALAFAVGKEEQRIKRFLPIAGVCGLLSGGLDGTAHAGVGGGSRGP